MLKEYKQRIQYIGYDTIYSAHGDRDNALMSRACFADILNWKYLFKEHYELFMYADPGQLVNHSNSNYCLLTEAQLKKHIQSVRRLFPFKYSVIKTTYKEYNAYKIVLDVEAEHFYHRYLLTWIRYAYEWPFNVLLNDAFLLKHHYLNRVSLSNLFNLCASCFKGYSYNSGHAIYNPGYKLQFMKEPKLKLVIQNLASKKNSNTRVNSIYEGVGVNRHQCIDEVKFLDYWTDIDAFKERAKEYLRIYKTIK